MAGRRWLLEGLCVVFGLKSKACHRKSEASWRPSGHVRLCVEAGFMSDRKRGPVTPPAAAMESIYQSGGGE